MCTTAEGALAVIILVLIAVYLFTDPISAAKQPANNAFANSPPVLVTTDVNTQHNRARLSDIIPRGLVPGFHETFRKTLPSLGWRAFYMRHFGGLNKLRKTPELTDQAAMNNYLNCMGNTDNVYKYVDY